ncbi:class I SAM-dependent methyltransferase [Serpentinimonas raichei]|uniref:class I SAM-dependent methyltransferase n=1 Tax=Serpentinimonas raichei TaxID=1458425 RepID=UPI0009E3652B|nr:methyltransferase domain-containing protein [Serpentinimonas raichei]
MQPAPVRSHNRSASAVAGALGEPNPGRSSSAAERAWVFFRRWLANPLQMGSIIPSSAALGKLVAAAVRSGPEGMVLELGAGTGAITAAMLRDGIAPERLIVVEIVPEMAEVLRRTYPGVTVVCGDAWSLPQLLGLQALGRIGSVVCGIPMVLLSQERQQGLIDAIEAVAPGRGFLHFSYCITSPLSAHKLGLQGQREAWTPANFPPASVWRYTPLDAH